MKSKQSIAMLVLLIVASLYACSDQSPATGVDVQPKAAVNRPDATSTCIPPPLPTPDVILTDPSAKSTDVPRKIGFIRFEMVGGTTANKVTLKPPSGREIETRSVKPVGTPRPTGQRIFSARIPGLLAAQTKYSVYVSGLQKVGGCGQKYLSPAGFFKTGRTRFK
jgi:hypothetical protein